MQLLDILGWLCSALGFYLGYYINKIQEEMERGFWREGTTFIDDVINGHATYDDLSRYIEEYQMSDSGYSLAEYLGLTDKQYEKFEKDNEYILDVIEKKQIRNEQYY